MAPVEDLLPHRRPWLLVDRVLELAEGRVRVEKRLAANDPLLDDGALPELLIVEALAQAAACLRGVEAGARVGYLVAAGGFEFAGRARAGDTLLLTAIEVARLGALHRFVGEATVDGKWVARGELTFSLGDG
jgi:3-hydroxyacyl-[acyl-carrier-protein] dehydratase